MTRLSKTSRGFTLAEMLVSILVIFLLMGLALVAYRAATDSARSSSDRAMVNGLKVVIDEFKREFGVVPPLVKDNGSGRLGDFPIASVRGRIVPLVYYATVTGDMAVLRGETPPDGQRRYSTMSLAYYLVGALDREVDGVDGPGFVKVQRSGVFAPAEPVYEDDGRPGADDPARRGPRRYGPLFDTERGGASLWVDLSNRVRFTGSDGGIDRNDHLAYAEIRDRNGVPVRYYRWYEDALTVEQITAGGSSIDSYTDTADDFEGQVTGLIAYLNIPRLVLEAFGDPVNDPEFEVPVGVRDARYAIIAAGPNQLFGDVTPAELAADDSLIREYAKHLNLSEARLSGGDDAYRIKAIEMAREDNVVEVGS